MSTIRIFVPVLLLLFGLCVTSAYNNNLREFVCVWRKSATQHTAIRLRLGNGKTFFPHTRWPTYIYLHTWLETATAIWHILRRLELNCFYYLAKIDEKCDFCRIKDGGSSRWRIAFQPISSDSFSRFLFSIRRIWIFARRSLTRGRTAKQLTTLSSSCKTLCFLSRRISWVVSIWPPNDFKEEKKKVAKQKHTHTRYNIHHHHSHHSHLSRVVVAAAGCSCYYSTADGILHLGRDWRQICTGKAIRSGPGVHTHTLLPLRQHRPPSSSFNRLTKKKLVPKSWIDSKSTNTNLWIR